MATFKYLSDLRQDPSDESIVRPSIQIEFPNLNTSVEYPDQNPAIPGSRALVTVTNADGNMDRAILAIPNVSKYV